MTEPPRILHLRKGWFWGGLCTALLLFMSRCALAQIPLSYEGEGAPNAQQSNLGPLPDAAIGTGTLTLSDAAGNGVLLTQYAGTNAMVIVFLYPACPMCGRGAPVLERLWKDEQARGVQVLGVFTEGASPAELEKFRKDYGVSFPLLVDKGGKVASALSATVTPEAFVLDRASRIRYAGRINDLYQVRGLQSQTVVREDLREALDDVLSGSAVRVPRTLPVGCAIVRQDPLPSPTPEEPKSAPVTYHKDVAPILRNHCMMCHSEGNAGPFTLTSYDDASDWMKTGIREIKVGRMPPAQAESDVELKRANTISQDEIRILESWMKTGKPEGDPNSATPLAPLPDFATFDAELGPPDIILEQAEPFHLGPTGNDIYRHLVFTLNKDQDLHVRAIQMIPSDRAIVHHALIAYLPHQEALQAIRDHGGPGKDFGEGDQGPGFWATHGLGFRFPPPRPDGIPLLSFIGAYVPGTGSSPAPEDADFIIPAGSDLLLQMHYHRNGMQSQDSSRIGLWLRKDGKMPNKLISMRFVSGNMVVIPAGIKNMKVSGKWTVTQDCSVAGLAPHAHLLARSMEITATLPDKRQVTLVRVPHWQYNWQQPYYLKTPLFLPKGTVVEASGIFDNSSENPVNPFSPPRPVFLGESTKDEMLLPMLMLTSTKPMNSSGDNGFWQFGARLSRSIFLRGLYNDQFEFDVQSDGTVLRTGEMLPNGTLDRFPHPVSPVLDAPRPNQQNP